MGTMRGCYISMDSIELIHLEIRMGKKSSKYILETSSIIVISVSEYQCKFKTFFTLEEKIERNQS